MNQPVEHEETTARLAAYAAGTLAEAERVSVQAHLRDCAACERSLAEWTALRAAARAAAPAAVPAPRVLLDIQQRITARPSQLEPGLLWHLLLAQVPLVRRQIWAASALVLSLGVVVTPVISAGAATFLALIAPVVAAAGVGFIYGPENDPPLEVELATPTSPRLILLARLTLVFGYNFALALVLSALLALQAPAAVQLQALVLQWLGPMLLLSAISLALSLRFGSMVGVSIALILWAVRLILSTNALPPGPMFGPALALFGSTNLVTLAMAAALLVWAVSGLPRQEHLA